ncbi:homoserine dehydrogenase [Niallia taxi]|uniref:homoserine dehydrogenase n=1 Tax=Niallia taxi TaxID=2499688 RepID=UPI003D2C620C
MDETYTKRKIMITGYGTVAKEFVKMIMEQKERYRKSYGFYAKIVGIIGSKGMIYEEDGIDLVTLLSFGKGSQALGQYAQQKQISIQAPELKGDVLIECSPTNLETGEPALSYMKAAITKNMDIISVSKGALVQALPELKKLADTNGCRIKYSGATAAALPTLDIGEYSLAGSRITGIEGILNGTSNFILTSMSEDNLSFENALRLAQERGIAEANPALDVQGYDSACKILLLANGLFHKTWTLNDISIEGIEKVSKADMQFAKINGNDIKLVASARSIDGTITLQVKPEIITADNPLMNVKGTNKGILFHTEEMGTICCIGGASHPRGAAAAAIKDMLNLYRG